MSGLEGFISAHGVAAVAGAAAALAAGGFAKGVVGFALPLVALSAMGSFLPVDVALALLILPTLVTNVFQGLRNGVGPALGSLRHFWRLILPLGIMIVLSAQLVVRLPDRALFAFLGCLICGFAASQLFGWRLSFRPENRRPVEVATGAIGGFFGGISGIWGPPVVMYLVAANIPKVEMIRAQALAYLTGSVVLAGAHVQSGVLNQVTMPVSAWMIAPTLFAMFAGYLVQDRLDQERFRQITLAVLVVAGLNLLRRALAG